MRPREEELRILRGEQEVDEANMNFDDDDMDLSEDGEHEEAEEGEDEDYGAGGQKATMRRDQFGGQGGGGGGGRQQGGGRNVSTLGGAGLGMGSAT